MQARELFDIPRRQQVGARGQHLPELDEGDAAVGERLPQRHRGVPAGPATVGVQAVGAHGAGPAEVADQAVPGADAEDAHVAAGAPQPPGQGTHEGDRAGQRAGGDDGFRDGEHADLQGQHPPADERRDEGRGHVVRRGTARADAEPAERPHQGWGGDGRRDRGEQQGARPPHRDAEEPPHDHRDDDGVEDRGQDDGQGPHGPILRGGVARPRRWTMAAAPRPQTLLRPAHAPPGTHDYDKICL